MLEWFTRLPIEMNNIARVTRDHLDRAHLHTRDVIQHLGKHTVVGDSAMTASALRIEAQYRSKLTA